MVEVPVLIEKRLEVAVPYEKIVTIEVPKEKVRPIILHRFTSKFGIISQLSCVRG